mmetsp:Transcript_24941/g.40038  ORF Transcript_24941/g.40038 Transcript_24941/m.40038 type:complete len:443 (-) Transcript_24941:292-1620(-)
MRGETGSAIVVSRSRNTNQTQLAVQQRYALADAALKACGLVRPGCDVSGAEEFVVDEERISQMGDICQTRGVKKRLEEDFDLKIGVGDDVPKHETEEAFLARALVKLHSADSNQLIKAFDRIEKNNRKAGVKDAVFVEKQRYYRAKVAIDEATEKHEDAEHGTQHIGSPEEFADEFEAWYEKLGGEKDFTAWAAKSESWASSPEKALGKDAFPGLENAKVQRALEYFSNVLLPSVEEPSNSILAESWDTSRIKAEVAKWNSSDVLSSYRKLSRSKHPDKEGGSAEAFQELTDNAKVLMEACVLLHGKSKKLAGKASAKVAPTPHVGPKAAICAEVPENIKNAISSFGFREEDFFLSNTADVKKVRLRLSAEKERKEKQIQREKEADQVIELLRTFGLPADEDDPETSSKDLVEKSLKELKSMCVSEMKKQYTLLYGHLQKLK